MILDTTFILDLVDGDQLAFQKSVELHERDEKQFVALPTVYEIFYGIEFNQLKEQHQEYRRIQNTLLMYHIEIPEKETAKKGAELIATADLKAGGQDESGVDDADAIIAAVAEQKNDAVLTRNIDDFKDLGVKTKTY
jgi:predicted nucleic acid-binding protein